MLANITLVTGGTGFIGSHLVEELVRQGRKVRCLVKKDSDASLLKNLGVEIFYGDLTDTESLRGINEGVEVVYHLAAIARPMAIADEIYFRVNTEGTRNLLQQGIGKKLKKIIYISSVSAVGPSRDGQPVNERTRPQPIDTYGKSKLEAEKIVFEFIEKYNLPIVIIRPPMVFGPRDFEMLKMFKTVKTGFFPVHLNNNGQFEFCFVKNLIQACLLIEEKGERGEIYHVSDGRSYSLKEVLETIARAEKIKLSKLYLPTWLLNIIGLTFEAAGKILKFQPPFSRNTVIWMTKRFWISDISKLKNELGYQSRYSLKEGINQTVKWYQENKFL